ncbi:MAG: lysophospholipid acyltransferase family protein [Candidatus Paracaedibacteraceae bacterium]|nr:lysophospholipid acyltransferase family protein [Candidatus Paracaedibacteraceae bacterium]
MKRRIKQVTKSSEFQNFLSWVISLYLKLVFLTTRWTWVNKDKANPYFETGSLIVCFWHGNLAMIPFMNFWPHKHILSMVSGHGDGMMVARTFKRLGIDYTTGSTNRGGARAFLALLEALRSNNIAAIIPDGPRGPARELNVGVIQLSRHGQAPIMPLAYATSRFIQFKSWDKFKLPLPFSKGVFIYGDPIQPQTTSDDMEIENWRKLVQTTISHLQDQADSFFNKEEK